MATIQQAEARVLKGEAAIKEREASGQPVPNSWLDAYQEAWVELLTAYERDHPRETAHYRREQGQDNTLLVQHHRLPGVR